MDKHLSSFVKWFPNLRHLKLFAVQFDRKSSFKIRFPNLDQLNIEIGLRKPRGKPNIGFTIQNAANLLRHNGQVKTLRINKPGIQRMTLQMFTDLLSENSSISKLVVNIGSDSVRVNVNTLNQLAEEHPSLVELNLHRFRFLASEAINFITQLKSLKFFRFTLHDMTEYDHLAEQLDNEWVANVSILYGWNDYITMIRKNE